MQDKKRTAEVVEDTENRGRKRQRRSEETITVHSPQPTIIEHSSSTMNIPHEPTLSVSIRLDDTILASRQHSMHIPDVNVALMSAPASESLNIAIPSKRRNPFGGGGLRKKNKTERYVDVRVYAQRRDLVHIHEIQCALTPDGGLNLVSLSRELNLDRCQASKFPICSPDHADYPFKVLDALSRPWFSNHPVLERGAISLLKGKYGYLRVVGQSCPQFVGNRGI
jgi:hypothetical protein